MNLLTNVFTATCQWAEQRNLEITQAAQMDSTNTLAKSAASSEVADIKLYLTAHQLKGRGRGTNIWQDTGDGDCLLCSWSFNMARPPQSITGPCLGLALFKATQKTWPEHNWSIKAPNDLYLDGKKIAGILTESVSAGVKNRLLVGIGFNVLNHPRAIANSTHLDGDVDEANWFRFLDELLNQLKNASVDCQNHQLEPRQQQDLLNALNANPSKTFVANSISPNGDIVHENGSIAWTDL